MIWTTDTERAARAPLDHAPAGPIVRDRERHERIRQLAQHFAALDNHPTTTPAPAHWLQAQEIIACGQPLPRGLLAIPRDWCIVRFEIDPEIGEERVTPVLFMTEASYDNFINTWYREE